MATGSGTGTPASGSTTPTLTTIRDRIKTQLMAASGFTEPLAVTASSIALATASTGLRARVQSRLQDSGASRWSATDVDDAIREALEQYSQVSPAHAIGTVTLSANGREIDISTLTKVVRVEKVWWDYDSTTPGYPPNWRQFEIWPDKTLYIDDDDEPQSGDVVRIWYTKMHTVNGLDSATATTVPEEDISYLVSGAAMFAARSRAIELSETLNVDKDVVKRLLDWAEDAGKNFRYGARARPPAWQRYASSYDQDDIDEAIAWALQRYSEVKPRRRITSLTLEADGREVDISSITDYIEVERVWWNYDSDNPAQPPDWRDFELWSGDILYIDDPDEPVTDDVVRIWYTALHSINGLSGASVTTFDDHAQNLIVVGAAGYAAQERVQEEKGRSVPRKLREWAEARLKEFERGLKALASREAARHSGIAKAPALDRWDTESGDWR